MKLNAVGVTSSDLVKTVQFYRLLGFTFPEFKKDEQHIESITSGGSTKLMIDTKKMIKSIINEDPKPGNTSSFAIEYYTPQEVNKICQKIKLAGFTIVKEPWDAFWGQRYAIVSDPDCYKIDLYAGLTKI